MRASWNDFGWTDDRRKERVGRSPRSVGFLRCTRGHRRRPRARQPVGCHPSLRARPGCGQVGNILFLMMSDIHEPTQSPGRGVLGGNPGGVVSGETFCWWVDKVESNQDKIIVTAHHYVLEDTTVAFGDWEGMRRGPNGRWKTHSHGYKQLGTPRGRRICTGSTACRMAVPSSPISKSTPERSTSGWEVTPTLTRTIATAGSRTSRGAGECGLPTSPRSRLTTAPPASQ